MILMLDRLRRSRLAVSLRGGGKVALAVCAALPTSASAAGLFAGFALLSSFGADVRAQATFTPLPDLSGGASNCGASAVSADGTVVVGYGTGATRVEAVRWQNGTAEPLGALPERPSSSGAADVSGDGSVVVGSSGAFPNSLAFRWENGAMTLVPVLPGFSSNGAIGISENGLVIVGWSFLSQFRAFRFEGGALTSLADLPGSTDDSAASAVNADGSVVAGRGISPGFVYEACRWETPVTNAVPLGDLAGGAALSAIDCLNADGSVGVGFANSADQTGGLWGEATRWVNNGAPESLGDLSGGTFNGYAFGVSDDGNVIVGYSNSTLGQEAFIWDPVLGMRNLRLVLEFEYGLDLTGWTLRNASDVSANRRAIVGTGINPEGQTQAWVVRFTPPPCEGDADGNGFVNFADVTSVLTNFAMNYQPGTGPGDADFNGVVNFGDITKVLAHWLAVCP